MQWSEFLVKSQERELVEMMERQEMQYDLYILMDIEGVGWIQDGVRLAPETIWFQDRYVWNIFHDQDESQSDWSV
jgi:hypothetical protein